MLLKNIPSIPKMYMTGSQSILIKLALETLLLDLPYKFSDIKSRVIKLQKEVRSESQSSTSLRSEETIESLSVIGQDGKTKRTRRTAS